MKLTYALALAGALVLVGSVALAQPPAADEALEAIFKKADTNNDGVLDLKEFKAHAKKMQAQRMRSGGGEPRAMIRERLREADTDNDGKISPDEFSVAMPNAPKAAFKNMDRNGDGYLSPADRPEGPANARPGQNAPAKRGAKGQTQQRGPAQMLKSADADKDGKVTFEEVTEKKPGFPRKAFDRLDKNNDGVLTQGDVEISTLDESPPARQQMAQRVRAADTNKDGKLSLEEAKAGLNMSEDRFKQRDKNGDGFLTREDRAKQKRAPKK